MQSKTEELVELATKSGLRVIKPKTKAQRIKAANDLQPITIEDEELEDVNRFSYLGSKIDSEESSIADISSRIGKAQISIQQINKRDGNRINEFHTGV